MIHHKRWPEKSGHRQGTHVHQVWGDTGDNGGRGVYISQMQKSIEKMTECEAGIMGVVVQAVRDSYEPEIVVGTESESVEDLQESNVAWTLVVKR